jgi:PAS domain S-box-containing protein
MSQLHDSATPLPLSTEEMACRIKQLEEELRKVTSNFNRALEQGNAVVYIRNFDSNSYEYMGHAAEDILGYTRKEITPTFFDAITISAEPQGDLAKIPLEEAYRLNRSGSATRWIADTQVRCKSGEVKYIIDMSTTLHDCKGRCYGAMGIFIDITERKRMEQDLSLASRELRLKNEEMELDLEMAREIQVSLLAHPHRHFPVTVPEEQSAVRFHNFYVPTKKLSGDFFYVIPVSETQVGVFIGDVMGHGVRASLITAFLRGLMEDIKPFAYDSGLFLQKLNNGLLSVLARPNSTSFVTAVYIVVDINKRELHYSNAGHPEPHFVNRSSGAIPLPFGEKRKPEPAIGLISDFPYSASVRPIATDDIVYCFTDGVYDVTSRKEEIYGRERLLSFINGSGNLSPDLLLDNLLREIRSFAGSPKEFNDDLCMLAMHIVAP